MTEFPTPTNPAHGADTPSNLGAGSASDSGLCDQTITFGAVPPQTSSADGTLQTRPLSQDEQLAVTSLPASSALLIMQPGPGSGARFLLDADRTDAGRSERADIFLDDVTVSRKHAQFMRDEDGYVVRDSGSLNGTYVNRQRIDVYKLRVGDEVQIGKYRMTYHPGRQGGGA